MTSTRNSIDATDHKQVFYDQEDQAGRYHKIDESLEDGDRMETGYSAQDRSAWIRPEKGTPIKRKRRRSEDSILAALCAWIVEHQVGIAVNLLLLLALTHLCFPRARRHTRKFFELSYYNESTENFSIGWDDAFFVMHWIIVFTGLRVAVMDYVLVPLARKMRMEKKKDEVRFAEQAWVLLYAGVFWSFGMYIMYNSDYWLNLRQCWTGWPNRQMDGLFKWYYLAQFAFWLQQIFVVNIEERRKDHAQMFTHHLITCTLMFTSYGYHQTKVGNVILCLMDVIDVVLPLAKLLKYMNYQLACNITFGVFLVTWVVARHVFYLMVCFSLYSHSVEEIIPGCYWGPTNDIHGPIEPPNDYKHLLLPFTDPNGMICWTRQSQGGFLTMLLFLQVILLIWFGMITRLAWKIIKGSEADDPRSDDEDEEGEAEFLEDDVLQYKPDHPFDGPLLEEEVGVEAINFDVRKSSPARMFRKGGGSSSGVTLPSDRKELLGRIGCDKGGA